MWKEAHNTGKRNSRITPWGARCGIVAGAVSSQLQVFGDYGVIAGVLISSAVLVAVSLLTRDVPTERIFQSEADTEQIWKAE